MRVKKGKTSFSSNSFTLNERRVARVRCCLCVFHHRARDILRVRRVCVVCARPWCCVLNSPVFEAAEAVEAVASNCHSTRGTDRQQHTKHQLSFINNKYSVKNVFICFPVDKKLLHDLWCHDVVPSVQLEVSSSEVHGVTELDKNISLLILQKRLFRIKTERNVAARDMTLDMR